MEEVNISATPDISMKGDATPVIINFHVAVTNTKKTTDHPSIISEYNNTAQQSTF
jgi:hypothetical protein